MILDTLNVKWYFIFPWRNISLTMMNEAKKLLWFKIIFIFWIVNLHDNIIVLNSYFAQIFYFYSISTICYSEKLLLSKYTYTKVYNMIYWPSGELIDSIKSIFVCVSFSYSTFNAQIVDVITIYRDKKKILLTLLDHKLTKSWNASIILCKEVLYTFKCGYTINGCK